MFDIRGAQSDVQVDEPKAGVDPQISAAAFFFRSFPTKCLTSYMHMILIDIRRNHII